MSRAATEQGGMLAPGGCALDRRGPAGLWPLGSVASMQARAGWDFLRCEVQ